VTQNSKAIERLVLHCMGIV